MARNEERDRQEADRRKDRLIQAGFELFAEHGIESTSLSAVAEKAEVGVATMYKYFQNKVNLTAAISGRIWGEVWDDELKRQGADQLEQMTPCQLFDLYADSIISIFKNRPEVLRFSGNYKTYIHRQSAAPDQLGSHLDPLEPITSLFHNSYEAAVANGQIRSDVPEETMLSFTALTMLAMAERYAQGIVWTENPGADHSTDLMRLKTILLTWMKG